MSFHCCRNEWIPVENTQRRTMQAGARTDSGLRPPTAGCQVKLQAGLRACEGHETFTFPCLSTVVSRRVRSLTVAGAAQVGSALPWRRWLAPCFPLNCNPVVNRITSTWNVRECRQFRGKRQCRGKTRGKRLETGIKPSPRMPLNDDACNFGTQARSHTSAFAVRTIALGLKSQNPRP